jgi:hypothetical protein
LELLEDYVVKPLNIQIPWSDYQQGETNYTIAKNIPNLNPTIMLNRVRSDNNLRRSRRKSENQNDNVNVNEDKSRELSTAAAEDCPLGDEECHASVKRQIILSRFGGTGSHRYSVGFAGDQIHVWEGLQTLPGFTATSSNVGYGERKKKRVNIVGVDLYYIDQICES